MREKGFAFIELLVVISIIGILAGLLSYSYREWHIGFKVEQATKQLYADLLTARAMAFLDNIEYYAVVNPDSYAIFEDTNGNGTKDAGDRTLSSFPKKIEYWMSWNRSCAITFQRKGLISTPGTIRFPTENNADYDCIKLSMTRIIMGKNKGTDCDAK